MSDISSPSMAKSTTMSSCARNWRRSACVSAPNATRKSSPMCCGPGARTAIKRLAGMYAFVAVDTATGEFLAARDPFGVKPLYLIQSPNGFLFCSEIRPLAERDRRRRRPVVAAGLYAEPQFLRPPLRPARRTASNAASPQRAGSYPVGSRAHPYAVKSSGRGAVQRRHRQHADHALCAAILSAMPGYIAVGANAPDHIYAKRYAEETGLDLREVAVEAHCARTLALLETVVNAVETFEPAVIRSSLHTYLLSQRIHQDGFRVALCGEGADELFAGYSPLESAFTQSNGAGRYRAEAMSGHDAPRKSSKGRPLLNAIPARNPRAVPRSSGCRLCNRA